MKGGGKASLLKACQGQVTTPPRKACVGPDLVATIDPGGLLHCARGDDHPHAPVPALADHSTPSSSDHDYAMKVMLSLMVHLCPVMAPPRASTRKLTRKPSLLQKKKW